MLLFAFHESPMKYYEPIIPLEVQESNITIIIVIIIEIMSEVYRVL